MIIYLDDSYPKSVATNDKTYNKENLYVENIKSSGKLCTLRAGDSQFARSNLPAVAVKVAIKSYPCYAIIEDHHSQCVCHQLDIIHFTTAFRRCIDVCAFLPTIPLEVSTPVMDLARIIRPFQLCL
jgi:hypothetical protein